MANSSFAFSNFLDLNKYIFDPQLLESADVDPRMQNLRIDTEDWL